MRINVKLVLSLLFVFIFLSSCSTKKEDKNTSDLLLFLEFVLKLSFSHPEKNNRTC
nr:hypothetical protein [Leptospira weilii]